MSDNPLAQALENTVTAMPDVSPAADSLQQKAQNASGMGTQPAPQALPPAPAPGTPQGEAPKRGRGRPPKDPNAPVTPRAPKPAGFVGGGSPSGIGPVPGQPVQNIQDQKNLAIACVQLMEQTGGMIAGEAARMDRLEKENLESNFTRYMVAKNISDIPPGLALTLGIFAYYGRVIQSEPAQPKVNRFIGWVSSKIGKIKYGSRFNRRNDGKREDDPSKKADTDLSRPG